MRVITATDHTFSPHYCYVVPLGTLTYRLSRLWNCRYSWVNLDSCFMFHGEMMSTDTIEESIDLMLVWLGTARSTYPRAKIYECTKVEQFLLQNMIRRQES